MNLTVKFMRYTAAGSDEFTFVVPQETIDKYPETEKNSLPKRVRLWATNKSHACITGNHIITRLLYDGDFLTTAAKSLDKNTRNWFDRAFNHYTSNLYLFFYNSEDSKEEQQQETKATPQPKTKKERKERQKKVDVVKEKKITFKQLRTKIKSKMKVIKALQHWEDPVKVRRFSSDPASLVEKERYENVLTQIFKSYKLFFEEVLNSRNIPFYITKESYSIPSSARSNYPVVEYVFVDNKENVPVDTMLKQSWKKITVSWLTCNKRVETTGRWANFETFLSIDKVGLSKTDSHYLRKKDIKYFKTMRESTFTEMIEQNLTYNNEIYASKVEEFKSVKTRLVTNQTEENKLKDFIVKNLISVVEPKNLHNSALNLDEESFEIKLSYGRGYSFKVLEIRKSTDNLEKLTFYTTFFGINTLNTSTATDTINLINNILGINLKTIIETIEKSTVGR